MRLPDQVPDPNLVPGTILLTMVLFTHKHYHRIRYLGTARYSSSGLAGNPCFFKPGIVRIRVRTAVHYSTNKKYYFYSIMLAIRLCAA